MPRLLWVNHFANTPDQGGGTRHFEMGRELARGGWQVTVAASDFNLQRRRYVVRERAGDRRMIERTVDGVRFQWLWAASYERNDWHRAWNWLSFALGVWRWPRTDAADVVIGSSPHLLAALAAQRVARRWKVPFVFEVRDLWPESLIAAGGGRGVMYRVFERIAQHLYRTADHVMVLAAGSADYLVQRGIPAGRITLIPNGVDASAFARADRPSRDTFTVVYTGAHGPANGLDVVLDAAERLKHRRDVRWLFVGDGPARATLKASAERRNLHAVEFREPVPKAAIPALMQEVDAGLMVLRPAPLFEFGVSPNKLFDYMGAALPVICNVPGEVAGMVKEASAGVQTTDASGAALAEAVERLAARSLMERAAMGAAGRSWVTRERDRPVVAARLDATLRSVMERHARA